MTIGPGGEKCDIVNPRGYVKDVVEVLDKLQGQWIGPDDVVELLPWALDSDDELEVVRTMEFVRGIMVYYSALGWMECDDCIEIFRPLARKTKMWWEREPAGII